MLLMGPAFAAGPNATAADTHHLPFAEASLGHKPRKQKARSSQGAPTDEGASPDADTESLAEGDSGSDKEPQQPPTLAAEARSTEVNDDFTAVPLVVGAKIALQENYFNVQ